MDDTADLLAGASLILAALAFLYTLWGSDIRHAQRRIVQGHREDRERDIADVKRVLRTESWPLATAACLVTLILLPPMYGTLSGAWSAMRADGLSAVWDYDPVQALFVASWLGLAFVAYSAVTSLRAVRHKLRQLGAP